jgi:hypothetical protein
MLIRECTANPSKKYNGHANVRVESGVMSKLFWQIVNLFV